MSVRSDVLLIATGSRPAFDPLGPFNVDYQGTVNLVTAAKAKGYKKVALRRDPASCWLFSVLTCCVSVPPIEFSTVSGTACAA